MLFKTLPLLIPPNNAFQPTRYALLAIRYRWHFDTLADLSMLCSRSGRLNAKPLGASNSDDQLVRWTDARYTFRMSDDYTAKQNAIYTALRNTATIGHELHPSACVHHPTAGYIIAFRHPEPIMQRFTATAKAIQQIVPSMPYAHENGHTTLTVYQRGSADAFVPDVAVLEHLCAVAASLSRSLWAAVQMTFQDWLLDTDTVLVAGQPNQAFWEVGKHIQMAGARRNLDLRMPWGAHMTAARFLTGADQHTQLRLRAFLAEAPALGTSTPPAIEVGYYRCGSATFTLHSYQRFAQASST